MPAYQKLAILGVLALVRPAFVDAADVTQDADGLLEAVLQQRKSLATAYVEWTRQRPQQPIDSRARRMISRIAGDHRILTDLGPTEGPRWLTDSGEPARVDPGPSNYLNEGVGAAWRHCDYSVEAETFEPDPARPRNQAADPRMFGLALGSAGLLDQVADQLLEKSADIGKTLEMQGSIAVLTIRRPQNRLTLWVDTSHDFNPIKLEMADRSGKVVGRATSTLRQFEGAWYPEKVLIERAGPDGALVLQESIQVEAAEFNQPHLPAELTVADIGIDVGMPVARNDAAGNRIDAEEPFYWDGQALIPFREYQERSKAGTLVAGQHLRELWAQAARRAAGQPAAANASRPSTPTSDASSIAARLSEWEQYTLDFIQSHSLTREQSLAALRFLTSAQEHAQSYLARHKEEVRLADSASAAADSPADAGSAGAARAARARLLAVLDRIFAREIKERLDTILTRKQRATDRPAAKESPR